MADIFRKLLDRYTGRGGVKCQCCNAYHGKERKQLDRRVRRTLKQSLKKILDYWRS